jgi:opacity protein-like surface antigen
MGSRILLVLGASIALLPGLARAEWGEFTHSGLYLGAGGLFTQNGLIEDQISDALPIGISVDDSWGIDAVLGYRAFSFLAAELEYEYVNGYDISASGVKLASLQSNVLTANLKAIMPFWRIQPYLLGGVGFVNTKIDDKLGVGLPSETTDLAGRLGGGIDVHLTSRLVLNTGADVVLANTGLDSSIPGSSDIDFLGYVSVGAGLQYRFWNLWGR